MNKNKIYLENLQLEASNSIKNISSKEEIENWRIDYLGRKGKISEFFQTFKSLKLKEKNELGSLANNIKNTLERTTHLRNLEVIGEISNHFQSSSGHNYFSLKDEKAVIRCVMFKESSGIEYLENGQLINAQGYISFY